MNLVFRAAAVAAESHFDTNESQSHKKKALSNTRTRMILLPL